MTILQTKANAFELKQCMARRSGAGMADDRS
jgi:hypothetical protein